MPKKTDICKLILFIISSGNCRQNNQEERDISMTRNVMYFPIGTMVVLKDSTAAAMISGYLAENKTVPGYIWDYCGFMYPIGLRDENEVYTFDHTQIDQVLAIGYQDGEYFAFMNHLKEVAEKMAEIEDIADSGQETGENESKKLKTEEQE